MDILIAFYKVHYNFAALSVLMIFWLLYLLSKGNHKWVVIVLVVLLGYNLGMKRMIETNPVWFDDAMKKAETFDFVDWIWGGSAVTKQTTQSEKRLGQ